MSHQRQPGIVNAFLKIPKPLRLYFGVILGVALVFGSVFAINEMHNRMKPPDQILLEVPEGPPQTGFLKIYAAETVADMSQVRFDSWEEAYTEENNKPEQISIENIRIMQMQTGIPVSVGSNRIVEYSSHSQLTDNGWKCTKAFSEISNRGYEYNNPFNDLFLYLIAEADAYIEVTGVDGIYDACYGMGSGDFVIPTVKSIPLQENKNYYKLTAKYAPRHEINGPARDPDEELGSGIWNGDSRKRYYLQELGDAYPEFAYPDEIEGTDVLYQTSHTRKVAESALLFSAYDKTNPNILIAQAEVKITCYSYWFGFPDISAYGLHTNPDNYGYTTAEIVDYWENYDYTDYTVTD